MDGCQNAQLLIVSINILIDKLNVDEARPPTTSSKSTA